MRGGGDSNIYSIPWQVRDIRLFITLVPKIYTKFNKVFLFVRKLNNFGDFIEF